MRFSCRKLLILAIVIGILALAWIVISQKYFVHFTRTCNRSENFQEELHDITDRVHRILEALKLTHFLCYGSLWGQIRLARLLPWEDKVVMCLLNEELAQIDFVSIVRLFKKDGFKISYDMTEGMYVITEVGTESKMKILLIIFELDKIINMYRRIGWYRRLLPPSCESFETLDCFPPSLIEPPLPEKDFGRSTLLVPREGIELQKYHYRDNWWKEIPIKNC